MVTIKEATTNAIQFARDSVGANRAGQIRLEEVDSERIGGNDYWRITLSMIDLDDPSNELRALMGQAKGNREYKIFSVLKETGEVTSMRIREFAAS